MNPSELLQRYTALAAIAHHVPGRVRLKLNASLEELRNIERTGIGAGRFGDMLAAVPGIRQVRLNQLARSVTVEYDNQLIPDMAWPHLLKNPSSPEAAALAAPLRDGCLSLS